MECARDPKGMVKGRARQKECLVYAFCARELCWENFMLDCGEGVRSFFGGGGNEVFGGFDCYVAGF